MIVELDLRRSFAFGLIARDLDYPFFAPLAISSILHLELPPLPTALGAGIQPQTVQDWGTSTTAAAQIIF